MSDSEGVLLGIAMVLVMMNVVMVLWNREAYFAALWRILTLQGLWILLRRSGITRKPKQEKERPLKWWEVLAIEYDCNVGDDTLGTELIEAMKEALRDGVDQDELQRLKATMRRLSDEQGWDFSGTYNDGGAQVDLRIRPNLPPTTYRNERH
jgi:hypothetical protein